jgi:hypothetical protein
VSNSARFKISLRIWHPNVRSDDITEALGLLPNISFTAGDRSVTPKGGELGGVRAETFWSHQWSVGDSFEVEMAEISENLLKESDFLRSLRKTGGRLEYFIGWFSSHNSGFVLDHALLELLSDLKVDLAFDIYADDQPA